LLPPPAKFVLAPPARPINEIEPIASPGAPHDPFVARTNWQPPTPDPSSSTPRSMETAFPSPRQPLAGSHVAQTGDSWWSLAEAAYGDGRLYRALFAWNRALDPRVSLAAGTRLEVPPLAKLQAAWPRLVPAGEATAFDSGLSSAAP
jgi:nucleoid-associated protein YgaU